jgi:RNA polymerase sigma-70 factor (ECF subfamily)
VSPLQDQLIIDLFETRDESAISRTIAAYGEYCRSIAAQILQNPSDVEEVLSDTWLKAWQAIPPAKPAHLKLFLGKITRNLALSTYRAQTAGKRGCNVVAVALDELSECIPDRCTPEKLVDGILLEEIIQTFLLTVSQRERMIFIRRYFYLETTAQIARRYGLRESNVLMILSRTRAKLKKHLIQEGYSL